jgi:hypothetical protein
VSDDPAVVADQVYGEAGAADEFLVVCQSLPRTDP